MQIVVTKACDVIEDVYNEHMSLSDKSMVVGLAAKSK